MKDIWGPIIMLVVFFCAMIILMACLRGCEQSHHTFVTDKDDYRYVMLEEGQFNRLIKALENIAAQKGTNETSNR